MGGVVKKAFKSVTKLVKKSASASLKIGKQLAPIAAGFAVGGPGGAALAASSSLMQPKIPSGANPTAYERGLFKSQQAEINRLDDQTMSKRAALRRGRTGRTSLISESRSRQTLGGQY